MRQGAIAESAEHPEHIASLTEITPWEKTHEIYLSLVDFTKSARQKQMQTVQVVDYSLQTSMDSIFMEDQELDIHQVANMPSQLATTAHGLHYAANSNAPVTLSDKVLWQHREGEYTDLHYSF